MDLTLISLINAIELMANKKQEKLIKQSNKVDFYTYDICYTMNDKINLIFNISEFNNIAVNDTFLLYKKQMFAVFKHENYLLKAKFDIFNVQNVLIIVAIIFFSINY
jgi:hypothetical protein